MPERSVSAAAVIVVGASAGGVHALSAFLRQLPRDIDAAILVVLHIPAHTPSVLASVLGKITDIPVAAACDREPLLPGRIYVAPADRHLMVGDGEVRLTRGPKESRVRPSIDVLFRSAALAFGERVIGVLLTGMLDDGTAGLWAIKERGGKAIVQDPSNAEYSSMPESAIAHVKVDAILPIDAMAEAIVRITGKFNSAVEGGPVSKEMEIERRIADEGNALAAGVMTLGKVSAYTCPDCHGVLVQLEEGNIVRFRCHTGHAFSIRALLAEVNDSIDSGLWDTMRAIEERILLLRQIGTLANEAGDAQSADQCESQAREAEERVKGIRALVIDPKFFGHGPDRPV